MPRLAGTLIAVTDFQQSNQTAQPLDLRLSFDLEKVMRAVAGFGSAAITD